MARSIEDVLDELRPGGRPLRFRLHDGTEVIGVFTGRDEQTVRLENPDAELPIDRIEAVLIESGSEGPE